MVSPKNSWEKLINTAVTPLNSVPIKVAVGFAFFTNMAMKKGTNNGATSKLIVLYVISNKFPLMFPTTKLNKTIMKPILKDIYFANFT